ncbi:MAG: aspartate--tRNA ligase [Planctomycetota bacterium]
MSTPSSWKRTVSCGGLRPEDEGRTVTLNGWVANRRDHGQLFFLDLRDRYGVTQVTLDPENEGFRPEDLALAQDLGAEDVVAVTGRVVRRAPELINPNRATGAIEVLPTRMERLSSSLVPPFVIEDKSDTSIELRLQYRYLDLRRRPMLEALEVRSRFVHALRDWLVGQDFVEVETPILTKATPEGARDYLVPSRVHKGSFYALPQSPQVFKQILMVAGVDRYFQIARCFRDEDLRADRQPEFTQLDLEMSFVEEEDVLQAVEGCVAHAFREVLGHEVPTPFERIPFAEAMERWGVDKPDLRFGMELVDVGEVVRGCGFQVFDGALERGGIVKAIRVEEGASLSRKDIDGLTDFVKEQGAKGLAWLKVADGELTGPVAKFFDAARGNALLAATGAEAGDLLLFGADERKVVLRALGQLRNRLARDLDRIEPGVFRFCWVTAFPLFEQGDDGSWQSSHHPFTAPLDWDADFEADPGSVASRAYDLVLNGWELGSGSIRIHRRDVQERLFAFLGLGRDEVEAKFGHLVGALQYGAPPHGGFAVGIDRIVAMALGLTSIRDVIAFPKTASATCLMTDAPSEVDPAQLAELAIRVEMPATGTRGEG